MPTTGRGRNRRIFARRLAQLGSALVLGGLALVFVSGSAAWPPPEPVEEWDLKVDAVEVTQATQTVSNSIPLVARKSTAVRATIGLHRVGFGTALATPSFSVTGRLHVFVNGVEVTPAAGVPPINAPFLVPKYPQRNDEDDTLNFELYAPTPIRASADVDFRVEVFPHPGETDPTNNSGSAENLTSVERCTPWLYFTRVNYPTSGAGFPPLDKVKPGRGDAFVRGIFPVDDSDATLYRESTPLIYSQDTDQDGQLDWPDSFQLAARLEMARQLIVQNYRGANRRVWMHGWLAGNPTIQDDGTPDNGYAFAPSHISIGNTDDALFQRTYAHELIHTFDRRHNENVGLPTGLDEVGWDVGSRLVNNPTGNNETNAVKRETNPPTGPDFDVMTGGKRTNQAWINTITYSFLLNDPRLNGDCRTYLRPFYTEVAVVTGIIIDGQAKLRPLFRFPWKSEPTEIDEGRFLVEATDTNGVTTAKRFDPSDGRHTDDKGAGVFAVMLPVDPNAEIASVRIIDGNSTEQLAKRERSEPPRITIVSPQPGDALGERTEVQWAVDDQDTPDSELLFQAAYSHDHGRSWVPIGVDIAGTDRGLTLDSSQVAESAGEGIIRVFVSDGLNTAFDDVTELSR
jgi:hypothetical protein